MRIYKISQSRYNDMYDVYEEVDNVMTSIMEEYNSESRVSGTPMSWSVVPFGRLKKIWNDYMRYNVVHDTSGIDAIADKILYNIAKLEAATQLSGHSQISDEEMEERYDFKMPKGDNHEFYFDFLSTKFGPPITDSALKPLWTLAEKLFETNDYVQKLVIIDRILNVVHQRSDLAALFIEGGYQSLQELSGKQHTSS